MGDLITLQTSWGPIVIILSEQGELKLDALSLKDHFFTLQKLVALQLEKLKLAGYKP